MFIRKPPPEPSALEEVIAAAIDELSSHAPFSKEYIETVAQIEKLTALKNTTTSKRVSPDTWVVVGGNVAVALAILTYERANVITTKLGTFMMKASR